MTKTTVNPSTNGTLPASTRRGVGVAAGDDGEIAGNERQHARGGDRDEPREERGRDLPGHSSRGSSSSGRSRPPPASTVSAAGAGQQAHDRQHPREQVEPLLLGRGEDALAELRDELVLDLALRVARGDPLPDELLHAQRRPVRSTDRASCGRSGRRARPRARPGSGAPRSRARPARRRAQARTRARAALTTASSGSPSSRSASLGDLADLVLDDRPVRGRRRTSPAGR